MIKIKLFIYSYIVFYNSRHMQRNETVLYQIVSNFSSTDEIDASTPNLKCCGGSCRCSADGGFSMVTEHTSAR